MRWDSAVRRGGGGQEGAGDRRGAGGGLGTEGGGEKYSRGWVRGTVGGGGAGGVRGIQAQDDSGERVGGNSKGGGGRGAACA